MSPTGVFFVSQVGVPLNEMYDCLHTQLGMNLKESLAITVGYDKTSSLVCSTWITEHIEYSDVWWWGVGRIIIKLSFQRSLE